MPVGTYTLAFSQPNFTVQVELASIAETREVIEHEPWFDEIAAHLGLTKRAEKPTHFQLQELNGLVNTWAGFIGHEGVYAAFTLVRVCTCVPTERGQAFVPFMP